VYITAHSGSRKCLGVSVGLCRTCSHSRKRSKLVAAPNSAMLILYPRRISFSRAHVIDLAGVP
jgi:hypothetical protein